MTYLSNQAGDPIPPDQEILLQQIADLGTPLQYLRVNALGNGLEYATLPTAGTVYTEILIDSGDHQHFMSLNTINTIYSIMDAYSGKGIPASNYSFLGTTLTLSSPDQNLATDGIQLIYS